MQQDMQTDTYFKLTFCPTPDRQRQNKSELIVSYGLSSYIKQQHWSL
jgi:hypothetical protein